MKFRSSKLIAIASGVALAAVVMVAPAPAVAADYTYYSGNLVMNQWVWSGHHDMTGAKAYGVNYIQTLKLQNDGTAVQSGTEYIFIVHARVFTVSKCAWYNPGVVAGTFALQTCKYTN